MSRSIAVKKLPPSIDATLASPSPASTAVRSAVLPEDGEKRPRIRLSAMAESLIEQAAYASAPMVEAPVETAEDTAKPRRKQPQSETAKKAAVSAKTLPETAIEPTLFKMEGVADSPPPLPFRVIAASDAVDVAPSAVEDASDQSLHTTDSSSDEPKEEKPLMADTVLDSSFLFSSAAPKQTAAESLKARFASISEEEAGKPTLQPTPQKEKTADIAEVDSASLVKDNSAEEPTTKGEETTSDEAANPFQLQRGGALADKMHSKAALNPAPVPKLAKPAAPRPEYVLTQDLEAKPTFRLASLAKYALLAAALVALHGLVNSWLEEDVPAEKATVEAAPSPLAPAADIDTDMQPPVLEEAEEEITVHSAPVMPNPATVIPTLPSVPVEKNHTEATPAVAPETLPRVSVAEHPIVTGKPTTQKPAPASALPAASDAVEEAVLLEILKR